MQKQLNDLTVLVVDDSPLNLLVMSQVLSDAGSTVITAVNGRQALEKLEENEIDIVLMDLQMPVLDGFETTRVIRYGAQRYSNVPIIAVTAETASEEVDKCMSAGMNDFISKPFVPHIIKQKILALVQTTSADDASEIALKENNNLLPYDLSYLKGVTIGDTNQLLVFVDNLTENAPALLRQSQEAIACHQWKDAAGFIHKLKGLVGLFFMPQIAEGLQLAEAAVRAEPVNKLEVESQLAIVSTMLPVVLDMIIEDLKK